MIRYFAPTDARARGSGPRSPMIRASSLRPILAVLDQHQPRADRLLSRNMLTRTMVADPYSKIPLKRYVAFLEASAEACSDPFLCARVGTGFRAADLGPVGLVFGASATLRRGLGRLAAMLSAWQDGTSIQVEEYDGHLVWTYRLEDPALWPRRQDNEYTIAATIALSRDAFGAHGRPFEAHLEHAPPENAATLERLLGVRVCFGETGNRLFFDLAAAETMLRVEDADLLLILSRHLKDLSGRPQAADLMQRVRSLVRLHLGQRPVNLTLVADELSLSPRTLQRQLAAQGTTLRALLLEARLELGRTQLREGRTTNAEIARQLGYADSTALWRAFKKATGAAPSKHRDD
ncbi:AraC family transcriptional regulator ligand-binding domain-containing protein [Paracoccus sp. (in: a-proteobacteria)]|uniref:AraC family transcriptional regulator ligand-binding domain-containing protein n=1 Tax=Paracoccus sp. TaxID=267 RepID=UPI000C0AADBE|nr:MAG: AraC family transcriptional regulator [Paracoccus sp. (in: a-proteobacteria)]